MVAPGTVNMQAPVAQALIAEAEFLYYPAAGVILRPDGRLDPVQPHDEETMVHRHRQRRRSHAPPGIRLVDPVTHLTGPRRSPDDAAHGQLPGELALVG